MNSYNKYYNKHCIDETTGNQYAILRNLFWVESIRANISVLYRAASHFDYCLIAYLLHCCCIVRLSRLYIRSIPRGFEIARYTISRDDSPNRQQPHFCAKISIYAKRFTPQRRIAAFATCFGVETAVRFLVVYCLYTQTNVDC